MPGRYPSEDDDEDGDDEDSSGDEAKSHGGWEDDEVDTDVLPTLLVYRAGELIHSWIRVDWEAKMGIEELLRKYVRHDISTVKHTDRNTRHHILSDGGSDGNCGLPSDDDDDLIFSGSDDGYDL